ncbi:MAG TPA: C45 family peptidase [Bacillota bacterium]|nr:C45 family peptidase [Bacillota bacterium]
MIRKILVILVISLLVFQSGLTAAPKSNYQGDGVVINDKGNYYEVTLDFNSGLTHQQVGESFAKGILELIPNYEALVDSYIAENLNLDFYKQVLTNVQDLKPQLPKDYADEIAGMAAVFSGGAKNIRKDNRLSRDEFFLFNLFPDAARATQCSFVSVFGARSATQSTITGRNLDWFGGSKNQLPKIQAVITMKNKQRKLCSIGFLGYMGIITGFNDSKVFAGILDSQSYAPYTAKSKHSYPMDLRFALENYQTLDEIAGFMLNNANNYTVNHLIAFSDPKESKVLENNFSGKGSDGQKVHCGIRSWDSKLNKGVTWGISDAIGCVNSFILYGNFDNQNYWDINTLRWDNLKRELLASGPTVTPEEIKKIITYHQGAPGAMSDSGHLYNKMTLHTVIFQPDNFSLEVFFRPKNVRRNPVNPIFEKISVFK